MKKNIIHIGLWRRLITDLKLLAALAKDYWKGNYRDVSMRSFAALLVALAYILVPFDLLSDFLPGLGQVDDAAVFLFCLFLLEKDLYRYQDWKTQKISK